jgi:hypothetical protein
MCPETSVGDRGYDAGHIPGATSEGTVLRAMIPECRPGGGEASPPRTATESDKRCYAETERHRTAHRQDEGVPVKGKPPRQVCTLALGHGQNGQTGLPFGADSGKLALQSPLASRGVLPGLLAPPIHLGSRLRGRCNPLVSIQTGKLWAR